MAYLAFFVIYCGFFAVGRVGNEPQTGVKVAIRAKKTRQVKGGVKPCRGIRNVHPDIPG